MNQVLLGYDIILGRYLMKLLKLDVKYSSDTLQWESEGEIPLKPLDAKIDTHFFIDDPDDLIAEVDKMSTILDSKYAKVDLAKGSKRNPKLK